jgi:c-di-GMP-binding flagellar brake protein YcgR
MPPEEPKAQEEPKRDVELRRSPRLQCSGHAGIQLLPVYEKPCPGKIINLSMGGCLVALKTPLDLVMNETVELLFSVNQMPFRVRGKVRSIRSEILIGFQFSHVSNRVRARLEDLIKELIEHLAKQQDGSTERRPQRRRRWY